MIKVMFVCLGNICRSPMAEFILKDMVKKRGIAADFEIASSATSTEEWGNPLYPPAARKLAQEGVPTTPRQATQLKKTDYDKYDYIIAMERRNVENIKRICGGDPDNKVSLLLSFAGRNDNIADPWYTGNFDITYDEIVEGCEGFLSYCYYAN